MSYRIDVKIFAGRRQRERFFDLVSGKDAIRFLCSPTRRKVLDTHSDELKRLSVCAHRVQRVLVDKPLTVELPPHDLFLVRVVTEVAEILTGLRLRSR